MQDASANPPSASQIVVINDRESGRVLQTVGPVGTQEVRTYLPDGSVTVHTTAERPEVT